MMPPVRCAWWEVALLWLQTGNIFINSSPRYRIAVKTNDRGIFPFSALTIELSKIQAKTTPDAPNWWVRTFPIKIWAKADVMATITIILRTFREPKACSTPGPTKRRWVMFPRKWPKSECAKMCVTREVYCHGMRLVFQVSWTPRIRPLEGDQHPTKMCSNVQIATNSRMTGALTVKRRRIRLDRNGEKVATRSQNSSHSWDHSTSWCGIVASDMVESDSQCGDTANLDIRGDGRWCVLWTNFQLSFPIPVSCYPSVLLESRSSRVPIHPVYRYYSITILVLRPVRRSVYSLESKNATLPKVSSLRAVDQTISHVFLYRRFQD